MANVQYANQNSPGAFANVIGWIDFSEVTFPLTPNTTTTVTNTIPGGYTITFNLENLGTDNINGSVVPVVPATSPFGNTGYVGVGGEPALLITSTTPSTQPSSVTTSFIISNITVKDSNGISINNYSIFAADAERVFSNANITETLSFETDGKAWAEVDLLPPVSGVQAGPTISLNGQTVTITGSGSNPAAPVFSTISPKTITTTYTLSTETFSETANQAVAFGIIIAQTASCSTNVGISPNNTIIYVCPGKRQFFSINSTNCCGVISLYYLGENFNSSEGFIEGNLGNYTLLNSGILLDAPCNIQPGDYDVLSFQVVDSSCNLATILNVVFTYSACQNCN